MIFMADLINTLGLPGFVVRKFYNPVKMTDLAV
jgi:hypothetical protein